MVVLAPSSDIERAVEESMARMAHLSPSVSISVAAKMADLTREVADSEEG